MAKKKSAKKSVKRRTTSHAANNALQRKLTEKRKAAGKHFDAWAGAPGRKPYKDG